MGAGGGIVKHRLHVVSDIARDLGAGAALLSDPATLRWLGVTSTDDVHALVSAGDAVVVASADALTRALAAAGLNGTDPVALDSRKAATALVPGLRGRARRNASAELAAARACKERDELVLIERAAELVAAGQAAARADLRPGAGELDLWRAARAAMERAAGGPVEAGVDLMVGERTALVGQPPGHHAAVAGDPVLFDLAPRRDGYWADSCATFACGVPTARLRRRHDAVRAALEAGLGAARPGITAAGVDARMRAALDRAGLECPHHTGHGVGAAPQEAPWLDRGEDAVLAEGMVLALEPGAYSDGFGVRLEHLVVIEADGPRRLTNHSLSLI